MGACGQRPALGLRRFYSLVCAPVVPSLTASGRLRARHCWQDGARQCCRSSTRASPALPATRPRAAADGAAAAATCRQVIPESFIPQLFISPLFIPYLSPSPFRVWVSVPAVHASARRQGAARHLKYVLHGSLMGLPHQAAFESSASQQIDTLSKLHPHDLHKHFVSTR